MNLLALRYFLEVANHLNFSKASSTLHVSQPGLSQQIKALEEELGFKLLERTTRKVKLTQEGEYLYNKLRPSFESIENTMQEIVNRKIAPQGIIKVATVPSAASLLLPELLTTLHEQWPDIEFYLTETTSMQALDLIRQEKSHIAFIRTPIDIEPLRHEGLGIIEFTKYPMQLVVAAKHWIAHQKSVDLSDVRDERFIHYDPKLSPSLYTLLESACLTAGFVPKTLCVGPEILTIASLVAHGLGVTLMPADMFSLLASKSLVAIALKHQQLYSSISAVWKNSSYIPPILQYMIHLLMEGRLDTYMPRSSL